MKRLDPLSVPLRGTTLIEASAGTGKTYTLTTLYLRLLLEAELDVGKILVVTYTNAATAELRDRVRRRLRSVLSAVQAGGRTTDETLQALLEPHLERGLARVQRIVTVALQSFDNAAIFTIHGFCQRMLQDHAFESRVSFDAELMSDVTKLRDEVVRDFCVRRLYDASDELIRAAEKRLSVAHLGKLARKLESHPNLAVLPERIAETEVSGDQPEERVLSLQLEFTSYARAEMRGRMEESNMQSFDDLLQRLDEALEGPGGTSLAHSIRERFPAALIDEFQDTDPIQYRIFRRAYHETGATLFLIGDPKQAIYAFRGADVFTYIDAKHDAEDRTHTLETNWRSDPGLLRAVNTLFGRVRRPFLFEDIPFIGLQARPEARDSLVIDGVTQAPFQILFYRGTGRDRVVSGRRIKKPEGQRAVYAAIAREIACFLRSGATLEGRPVVPADVAVLCRTNEQARCVQEQLRLCGVPSALQGDASVFDAPEADELERMLRPVADPGDFSAARAALVTSAIGLNAEELLALQEDERRWNVWAERFEAWHAVWLRHGFMPAFRRLLDDCSAPANLLELIDGERRLTNFLHLGELLHRASVEQRLGPLALVEWLCLMRQDPTARQQAGGEAAQIRLESDAEAAKLTTIHKSKGLEYPVVYCPFMWDEIRVHSEEKQLILFHDPADGNRLKLDLGSEALANHQSLMERELLAEGLRLLYVALTRAKHRCSVVWGPFNKVEGSALGYLLHQEEQTSTTADHVKATEARIKTLDDDSMLADVERLARESEGVIEVRDLPASGAAVFRREEHDPRELRCREATRKLDSSFRISSFSRLVSGGEPHPMLEEAADYDEVHVAEAAPVAGAGLVPLNEFPAGARPGQLLHAIFENLDFTAADGDEARDVVTRMLSLFGIEGHWAETIHRAIADVLATPLDDGPEPLRLRSVSADRRLNELEFLFPVAHEWSPETARLTSGALAAEFARHARPPVPAAYAQRVRALGFTPLKGYLTGFIDLVFEHAGRWYLIDYKSNHLGSRPSDYALPRLIDEMVRHHYVLQYHLYAVALHRYLAWRLSGYDYERHFGGVYYLFVRGMSADDRLRNGVFYDRPPRSLIEGLSQILTAPSSDRGAA